MSKTIDPNVDSVMDILVAQCSDLEALLLLARQETSAIEQQDFDNLISVVSERSVIGKRLESYHRQLAELRSYFGDLAMAKLFNDDATTRCVTLISQIQTQDNHNQNMLVTDRAALVQESKQVTQAQQHLKAYGANSAISIACDCHI